MIDRDDFRQWLLAKCDVVDAGYSSPCWVWHGAKTEKGYGKATAPSRFFGPGNKTVRVHRISYIALAGEIPDGWVIDHLCRNPPCCNPAHLEAVTVGENTRRMAPEVRARLREHLSRLFKGRYPPKPPKPPKARQPRPPLTHCKRGHEFTAENTRIIKNGRQCWTCRRMMGRLYEARLRAEHRYGR